MAIKYIISGSVGMLCGVSVATAAKGHYEASLTMLSLAVFLVLVRVIIAKGGVR